MNSGTDSSRLRASAVQGNLPWAMSWAAKSTHSAAEFYAVSVDMKTPYWIYGGTQDNAALYGPSDVALADASVDPWENVYLDRWTGGDSFTTLVDPTDDRVVYYEHQMGATGPRIFVPPYSEPVDPDIHPLVWRDVNLIGVMFDVALVALLLHPMSVDYRRVWFR